MSDERRRVQFNVEVVATVPVDADDQELDELARELCAATRAAIDERLASVTCVGDWQECELVRSLAPAGGAAVVEVERPGLEDA